MNNERALKRISLMIGEDQYDAIMARGMNLSWLVRDLVDDYLRENRIVLKVSDDTRKLYEQISSLGVEDEFEKFFMEALHSLLKMKIQKMLDLEKTFTR
jgi:hypothetical protein